MEAQDVCIEVGDTLKNGDYTSEVVELTEDSVKTADGRSTYRHSVELNIAHDDRKLNVELIKA